MFDTIVQRGVGFMLIAIIVYLLLRLIVFRPKKGSVNGVDRESFELKIFSMNEHCSEYSLKEFMKFLDKYKGGRVIKERGRIIQQEFTVKEKGELKSLFYDVVAPAKDVSIATKEQFRNYIRNLKVDEVDMRPRYEDYTRKITDRAALDEDKVVSYFADYNEDKVLSAIRKGLDSKQYVLIDNPTYKIEDENRGFGYIVVGESGAFIIEADEPGSILAQKAFIDKIGSDFFLDVHPIVVLTGNASAVVQDDSLPYKVIGLRNLCNYIREYQGRLPINERMMLVSRLNELVV